LELETIAIIAGLIVANYVVVVQVGKRTVKQAAKATGIENLLKQFGIKNFNIKELNGMTDEGFIRLVQLLRELKTGSSGFDANNPLAMLSALQGFGQHQQSQQAPPQQPSE